MQGVRCLSCGDTRWSLFGRPVDEMIKPCELCGGETVAERRQPRPRPVSLAVERRREVVHAEGPPPA